MSEHIDNAPSIEEADALETLTSLGQELASARNHVDHVKRHLHAAVIRAWENGASPREIIAHSGLARQTVYNLIQRK